MLRKASEIRNKKNNASSKRNTVKTNDTLMTMIQDRKARESRQGATDTTLLEKVYFNADEDNKEPIILDTTLEEMKQIEYVN
jgi:hypothetical protein